MVATMTDEFDFPVEEMKSRSFAQAWVRRIDHEHCEVTLGDWEDINSPQIQSRINAMSATIKIVSLFGKSVWNIHNENSFYQLLFCITYRIAYFFQKKR